MVASGHKLPGLLQAALLRDPAEPVRLRCLSLLERYGIPEIPEDLTPEEVATYEDDWIEVLVRILESSMEGAVSTAACRALAKISDAPFRTLRPEAWVEWRQAKRAEGSS